MCNCNQLQIATATDAPLITPHPSYTCVPCRELPPFQLCSEICGAKGLHFGGKRFTDDKEVETEVWKWLRQQSKDLYAAGFDALVKRWDKCINVGGGYVEK
jgi:hypothetical protein